MLLIVPVLIIASLLQVGGGIFFALIPHNWTAFASIIVGGICAFLLAVNIYYRDWCDVRFEQPYDYSKPLMVIGMLAGMGGFQSVCLYIALSVKDGINASSVQDPVVNVLTSLLAFGFGASLMFNVKPHVTFDRQPNWTYRLYLTHYCISAGVAYAAMIYCAVALHLVQVSILCGIAGTLAAVVAFESRYRFVCFYANKPAHNHLKPLDITGAVAIFGGLFCAPYFAFFSSGYDFSSEKFLLSPLVPLLATLWMERWGVTLCWTVWYFRSTEDSASLLVQKHHSFTRPPAVSFLITQNSAQTIVNDDGSSSDYDESKYGTFS